MNKVTHKIPTLTATIVGGVYASLAALSTQVHMSEGLHIVIIALLGGLATMLDPSGTPKDAWPEPAPAAAAAAATSQAPAQP